MARLVDIGGRKLEVSTSGTNSPVVIFESGAGLSLENWDEVRSLLDPNQQTLTYSRAGVGNSDSPDPASIIFDDGEITVASPESRTEDLSRLLEEENCKPPYVLVGHSLGGIFVRLFAAKFPDSVAGIVLVDSSHPDQTEHIRKAVKESDVPQAIKAEFLSSTSSPNDPVIRSASQTGPLRSVAITVISRDNHPSIDDTEQALSPQIQPIYARAWHELQFELTQLSGNSKHIIAAGAGHFIHKQSPDLVATAIGDMVNQVTSP